MRRWTPRPSTTWPAGRGTRRRWPRTWRPGVDAASDPASWSTSRGSTLQRPCWGPRRHSPSRSRRWPSMSSRTPTAKWPRPAAPAWPASRSSSRRPHRVRSRRSPPPPRTRRAGSSCMSRPTWASPGRSSSEPRPPAIARSSSRSTCRSSGTATGTVDRGSSCRRSAISERQPPRMATTDPIRSPRPTRSMRPKGSST